MHEDPDRFFHRFFTVETSCRTHTHTGPQVPHWTRPLLRADVGIAHGTSRIHQAEDIGAASVAERLFSNVPFEEHNTHQRIAGEQ